MGFSFYEGFSCLVDVGGIGKRQEGRYLISHQYIGEHRQVEIVSVKGVDMYNVGTYFCNTVKEGRRGSHRMEVIRVADVAKGSMN